MQTSSLPQRLCHSRQTRVQVAANYVAARARASLPAPVPTVLKEAPPALVTLRFKIHYKTDHNCKLCLVGNHEELGKWVVQQAQPMRWQSGHWWSATVAIPAGSKLEYKYVVVDSAFQEVRWQEGSNVCFDVPTAASVTTPQRALVQQDASDPLAFEIVDLWCKSSRTVQRLTPNAATAATSKAQEREVKQQERAVALVAGEILREVAEAGETATLHSQLDQLEEQHVSQHVEGVSPEHSEQAPEPQNRYSLATTLLLAAAAAVAGSAGTTGEKLPDIGSARASAAVTSKHNAPKQPYLDVGLVTSPPLQYTAGDGSFADASQKQPSGPTSAARSEGSGSAIQKQNTSPWHQAPQHSLAGSDYSVSFMHSTYELDIYTMYHSQDRPGALPNPSASSSAPQQSSASSIGSTQASSPMKPAAYNSEFVLEPLPHAPFPAPQPVGVNLFSSAGLFSARSSSTGTANNSSSSSSKASSQQFASNVVPLVGSTGSAAAADALTGAVQAAARLCGNDDVPPASPTTPQHAATPSPTSPTSPTSPSVAGSPSRAAVDAWNLELSHIAAPSSLRSSEDWPGRTLFELRRNVDSHALFFDEDDLDEPAAVPAGGVSLGAMGKSTAAGSAALGSWVVDGPGGADALLAAPATPQATRELVMQLGSALGTSVRLRSLSDDAASSDLLALDRQIALAASRLYSTKDSLLTDFVRKEGSRQIMEASRAAAAGTSAAAAVSAGFAAAGAAAAGGRRQQA